VLAAFTLLKSGAEQLPNIIDPRNVLRDGRILRGNEFRIFKQRSSQARKWLGGIGGVAMDTREDQGGFPTSAGFFLGLGLGGFFDGIVLHQILQWHHMVTSAGYPADSVRNLELNTLLDGLFHASTYLFVAIGLAILWRHAHRGHVRWSTKLLAGTMLLGFGWFNVVEGIVDHHLLGLHHVNETVPREQWIYWDLGFLVWGAAMILIGWALKRAGRVDTADVHARTVDRRVTPSTARRGGRRASDPHPA
jgi:uncharacterized membrane protein